MQIHQRTTYTYDGRDYNNLDALENGILSSIDTIVRSTPLPLHPKERRDVMDALVRNRGRLVKLLLGLDEVQDLIAGREGE